MCRVESFLYGKEIFWKLICGFEGRFLVIFAQEVNFRFFYQNRFVAPMSILFNFCSKHEFLIFDKKLVYGPEGRFYVIFAPKDEILILRPKIDLWTRGSILYNFCSKSEISILRPKLDLLPRGSILCNFAQKVKFQFFDQTLVCYP